MPRINLYVSDDLKSKMDQVELNWSRIASRAFSDALEREAAKPTWFPTEPVIVNEQPKS